MCVFLISPVPIAEPLTSELIDTPVFYNLAPRPIKYRVSVPIPTHEFIFQIKDVKHSSDVQLCISKTFSIDSLVICPAHFPISNKSSTISWIADFDTWRTACSRRKRDAILRSTDFCVGWESGSVTETSGDSKSKLSCSSLTEAWLWQWIISSGLKLLNVEGWWRHISS